MSFKSSLTVLALGAAAATGASSALAADWSHDSVGYRYYSAQSEPATSDKVAKSVLNFTHVSGDKLGTNFFTIDHLTSDNSDLANGNSSGASEWYGFYKRTFSLSAMTGNKGGYGFAKDVSLTARYDAGSKNTAFAPAPNKLRVGISADMPVSAGFWSVGLEAYKETNNNANAYAVNHSVNFDTVPALTSAWSIPVASIGATFGGFLDVVAAKGKDGFGIQTATETLLEANLMFDVGGAKSGLKAGVGLQYWNNKFGCDNGNKLSTNGVTNSCTATSPMLLVTYSL
jgi:hypothetical protein